MNFKGGVRKTTPKYIFQGNFLKLVLKIQDNFTFGNDVLNTTAKNSILMTFRGDLEGPHLNIIFRYILNIHPLKDYRNIPLFTL